MILPTPPPAARPERVNWRERCNLARSILNHREPSDHNTALAVLALYGTTAEDLFEMDRARLTLGEDPCRVYTFTESGMSA